MPARRAAAPETSGQVRGFDRAQVAAAFKQVPHPAFNRFGANAPDAPPRIAARHSVTRSGAGLSHSGESKATPPHSLHPQNFRRVPARRRLAYSRLSGWVDARVIRNHAPKGETQLQVFEFSVERLRSVMLGSQAYLTSSDLENSNLPE
jgi:hypothetical protein